MSPVFLFVANKNSVFINDCDSILGLVVFGDSEDGISHYLMNDSSIEKTAAEQNIRIIFRHYIEYNL